MTVRLDSDTARMVAAAEAIVAGRPVRAPIETTLRALAITILKLRDLVEGVDAYP